jgi:two-component system OmpR family response regulator
MTPAPNILIVADAIAGQELAEGLAPFRFDVQVVCDAANARARLQACRADLVVLDLMLRGVDGLALTRELRSVFDVPVILIGGHSAAVDRIVGLEMGADDCMDRPLMVRELVARIQTVLRRARAAAPVHADRIRFDGWELQRSERHLRSPRGEQVALSNAEFQLLTTFLQAPRRVVSRDDLASRARGRALSAASRSIDLLVSRLRHKLLAAGEHEPLIRSVRGVGYVFDARSVTALA